MQLPLEELAEISSAIALGEEAVEEQAWNTARQHLDDTDERLEALREKFRELSDAEKRALTPLAKPLRARRDALAASIPAPTVVSDAQPVVDLAQEQDPEAELPSEAS